MAALTPLRALGSPLARAAMRRAGVGEEPPPRHPLLPAAVRVERSTARRRGGEKADQTAVTLWFGAGPSLPAAAVGRSPWRTFAGVGATIVGAAALAAATTLASAREERRLAAAKTIQTLPAAVTRPPVDPLA